MKFIIVFFITIFLAQKGYSLPSGTPGWRASSPGSQKFLCGQIFVKRSSSSHFRSEHPRETPKKNEEPSPDSIVINYEKLNGETGDSVRSLTPKDIMDNIESIPPIWAQLFTVEQLRPKYRSIDPDGYTNNNYLAKPTITNDHYNKTELVESIAFLPVAKVRELRKDSSSYRAYGPLPHLPPEYIPYLRIEVISGLRKSIQYLADRLEFMTKEQIQALSLEQIVVLAKELENTGKNEELSSKQMEDVRKKYPNLFSFLRISAHNETLIKKLFDGINKRPFQIDSIPMDIIGLIAPKEFFPGFLKDLRRRSYRHFLEISPEQISEMEFNLQQYIVTERWKTFLRQPQPELRFRNLSIEKVKEMNPEDKQAIFEKMNLSEDLFMENLD